MSYYDGYDGSDRGYKREAIEDGRSRSGNGSSHSSRESRSDRKRQRKSRWSENDRVVIPGMPTALPPGLTAEQEKIYLCESLDSFFLLNHIFLTMLHSLKQYNFRLRKSVVVYERET